MISQVSSPRLKGFRFPRSIISYAVWAYHRFALSLRDVEDLLAERGVIVSYESIRAWCQRFGTQLAVKIRRDRPAPPDKWHLDEVVIMIRGQKNWLWRAVQFYGPRHLGHMHPIVAVTLDDLGTLKRLIALRLQRLRRSTRLWTLQRLRS
ncbi:MAG: hypothetical protein ACI9VX_002244 [Dinoroseobacter sp.]|jgi:hypothetical protein